MKKDLTCTASRSAAFFETPEAPKSQKSIEMKYPSLCYSVSPVSLWFNLLLRELDVQECDATMLYQGITDSFKKIPTQIPGTPLGAGV